MAVQFELRDEFVNMAYTTGLALSHAPGSDPNRILLVLMTWIATDPGTAGDAISTIDFDGVPLTQFNAHVSGGVHREAWYLVNPHSASGVISILPTFDYDGVADVIGCAATFSGVDQVTPLGSWNTATGSSNAPSVTVSSTSTDSMIVDILGILHGASYANRTVGSGQTLISNQQATGFIGGTFRLSNSDSYEAGSGAGVAMTWSLSASRNWGIAGFEVLPVAPAATVVFERISLEAAGPVTATAGLDPSGSVALDLGPARAEGRLDTRPAVGVSIGPELAVAGLSLLAAVGAAVGPGLAGAVLGLREDVRAQLGPELAAVRLDTRSDLGANLTQEGVKA